MVNVNHNNVDARYMNPEYWILDGITEDAMWITALQWCISETVDRSFFSFKIRNDFDDTYKLNKW